MRNLTVQTSKTGNSPGEGNHVNEDDTGELDLPTDDPDDSAADVLMVLAAASGIGGCLAWDVGPAFYFVPLGLAGFAAVCIFGSLNLANRVRMGVAIFAALATLGSGAIGFSVKSDYDQLSERAEHAVNALEDAGY